MGDRILILFVYILIGDGGTDPRVRPIGGNFLHLATLQPFRHGFALFQDHVRRLVGLIFFHFLGHLVE